MTSYVQVKKPDLNTPAKLGWCLQYVQNAYGAPYAGPDAWTSWKKYTKYKHTGTPPKGVYVPIWFSGYGGLGHVAVYHNGKVYSSPYTNKKTHDTLSSIAECERIYGIKYVGWSEDVAGMRVIKKGESMAMTKDEKKYYDIGKKAVKYKWEEQAKAAKELAEKIAKTNQTDSWLKKLSKLALGKR